METSHFCQSCGMPMGESGLKGTEQDGSLSEAFCTYCYQGGSFTQDVTLEEMITTCVPHLVASGMGEAQARSLLETTLPQLSRWKE